MVQTQLWCVVVIELLKIFVFKGIQQYSIIIELFWNA